MMVVEITGVSMPRRARPDRQLVRRDGLWLGSGGCVACSAAVDGDGGIPGLAGGDDGVQVAQEGGGEDGLGLGGSQFVVLAGGQVPVAGGVDRVGQAGGPHGAPGGQPQPGPALAGESGAADEGAGGLLPGCQAGVLDQGAGRW
jgi:hypothetical protein